MMINEVTLDRPEVFPGFSVIVCFCRLRLSRFTLKFSTEIFTPCKLFPPWSAFSEFVVPDKFAVPSAVGNLFFSPLWRQHFICIESSSMDF